MFLMSGDLTGLCLYIYYLIQVLFSTFFGFVLLTQKCVLLNVTIIRLKKTFVSTYFLWKFIIHWVIFLKKNPNLSQNSHKFLYIFKAHFWKNFGYYESFEKYFWFFFFFAEKGSDSFNGRLSASVSVIGQVWMLFWLIESFIVGSLKLIVYQVYCQRFYTGVKLPVMISLR